MASSFPTSLDAFTNPTATDAMDSGTVPHATQHSDLNDAVEALEAKVGADSSAVTSSHDYKIAQLEALGEYVDYSGSITISNLTLGNGTIVAKYARINDLVHYWGSVQWGSTTSLSGVPTHSVPIAAETGNHFGNATFADNGVNDYYGRAQIYSGTNMLLRVMVHAGATNYVDFSEILNYIPFTWGVNDSWVWNIVYKAA